MGDPAREIDRVVEHYVARLRQGEHPNVEDYAKRHPDLADEIREIFPLLGMMEGVKAGEDAGSEYGAEPVLPETIASYAIVRPIGRGGMGVVHEGRTPDGTRVAVKVIHPHLLGETRYVARFLREAEIGARLRHENVVRTIESGVLEAGAKGAPYLVLEYVEGQSLRALLREVGHVSERLCRHIGLCVARALEAFEAAGVVHRDLKPENVVITPDETVKVMDLGVASLHEAQEKLTQTGQFVGSFRYAAPEQLAGKAVDGRADLYALGVLLYELATGVHPASSREDQTVVTAPPPSSLAPGVSLFFDRVVATLLQPAPGDRFEGALALRGVLEEGEASGWWRDHEGARAVVAPSAHAPPFHGRDAELDVLREAARRLRQGRGGTILVEGEAGIGKSRLLREWLMELQGEEGSTTVLVARHDPGEGAGEVFPLGAAVRARLGGGDLEAALLRRLDGEDRLAADLARYLRGEGDAAGGMERLAIGLLRLFRTLAGEAPLVLTIEDLHFAGEATRTVVPVLARGLVDSRLLLCLSARPLEDDDPLLDVLHLEEARRLELQGLPSGARLAILHDAFGTGDRHPAQIADLARKSDGNPYFLLELASARREPDAAPGSNTADTSVPTTLTTMLRRRVAALSDDDRELLEVAACCGYVFDPELLAEAFGRGLITTLKRLGRMERRGGLVVTAGDAYRFHHHLLQEVLYDGLHPRLRKAHHASIGGVLFDRVGGEEDIDPDLAAQLCLHLFRGGRARDATPYLFLAEGWYRGRCEYGAGLAFLKLALEEEEALPADERAWTLYQTGSGSIVAGDLDAAEAYLLRACGLAEELGLDEVQARALRSLASAKISRREHDEGRRLAQAAIDAARKAGDPTTEAHAWLALALDAAYQEDAEGARRACDAAAAVAAHLDDVELHASVALHAARAARLAGDLDTAAREAARSASMVRARGDRGRELQAMEVEGSVAYAAGRFADALSITDRLIDLGSELGFYQYHVSLLMNGARCLLELGRMEDALVRSEEALRLARRVGEERGIGRVMATRAAALCALGRLEDARTLFLGESVEAVSALSGRADPSWRPEAVDVLGALGRFEEAGALLDGVLPLEAGSRSPRLEARLAEAEARLLERQGRVDDAQSLAERAAHIAHELKALHGSVPLLTGRLLRAAGRVEAARPYLENALAWGRRSVCPRVELPARVLLATLPGGDVLAARVAVEQHEDRLPRYDALEAHATLWEHTGEEVHRRRAREILEVLREGAAPEDRDRMVERVALYRRVQGA